MNSPDFDDEYTAPGHMAPIMPLALVPAGLCEHSFELQLLRVTIENLRAENDNLRAERDSLKMRLELECEND